MSKNKELSRKDKMKIINSDPILWCANHIKITDNSNNLVPFIMNDAQKDFLKNKGRFSIINKARQIGISTMMLGVMLWSSHQIPNSQYLMITDKGENTQNLFTRLKGMYDSLPDNIKVRQRRSNKYELFLENGSRISVQTAGNKELGRGFSCQIIHISEFAYFSDTVQEKALISLEQALLKNEDAFLCIESTANGIGNMYYNVFTSAEKGNSKYKAFFYSYNSKAFKKMFDYEIEEAVTWAKAQNKGQMYLLNSLDFYPEELELNEKYGVTAKLLLWKRYKMSNIGEDAFNQEFPLTSSHSFIQSDTGFFNATDITNRYKYVLDALPYKEIGKDLPDNLIKYYGKGLYIYEPFSSTERYFGGIDSSAGLKLDYSSINILDSTGRQVAVFNRFDIPIYLFARLVYDLGMYYNYCMFAIERNAYGLSLIDRLTREMRYIQVLRFAKFDKIKGVMTSEYGFYTDNVNKTKLMNDLKEAFETGTILINDKETLEQMKIYVQNKKGSLGNIRGAKNHDDLVDATALSVACFKENKSYL